MLVNRYKPSKLEDVVGHKTAISQISEFIKNYRKGKALLIHGSTGIGKTIISNVLSNDLNLSLTELHSSELGEIKKIKSSSQMMSLFGKKKIILIDEVDNFTERNTIAEIVNVIKTSSFPIILTADNAYDKKLVTLKNYCEIMPMRKLTSYSVVKKLKEICNKEGISADEKALTLIADNAHGDMRAAINDLQILSANRKTVTETDVVGFRERQISVFDAIKIIFKSNNLKEAKKAIQYCDKDIGELFWWIEENVTNEFRDPKQIADAYEILSKVDMFDAKIRQDQDWRMLKYMNDLLASITLIRGTKDNSYTPYKPPQRLIILGRSKIQRAENNEIYGQLGEHLHCSKRCIKTQYPFLNIITSAN